MAPILIHHLRVSQSERLVWLCKELGLDYDLKAYQRAPILAPAEYKALHRQGTAPVLEEVAVSGTEKNGEANLRLAESGACIEYICRKYAGGKLFLDQGHADYSDFVYWWYWASGTFQPALNSYMISKMTASSSSSSSPAQESPMAKVASDRFLGSLSALEERLKDNEWLAGGEFTVADIMVAFPLTTMRYFMPYSLAEYPHVVEFLGRLGQRAAYREAMAECNPGMGLVLGAEPPEKPLV